MTLYTWSKTAASDATADSTINWAEGQPPSSVNDSARAMMAAIAKYRDDNNGSLVTGGTSFNYTLTTNQVFSSRALLDGQELSFTIHATNGVNPTLLVDSIGGAFPIRIDGAGTPVPEGSMIAGSTYTIAFYSSTSEYRLRSFFVNPYNVPIGGMMEYVGSSVPNSNFVFPIGQAISRTTYATLFGLTGTAYGVGDGSATFNVPDLTGRVAVMKEASATRLTSTYFGGDSTALGAVGGGESKTLLTANLPAYTPIGTITDGTITISGGTTGAISTTTAVSAAGHAFADVGSAIAASQSGSTFTGTAQGGTSTPFRTVQPTIIVNKILRII